MKSYKHYIVDNHKIKEAALLRQPLFFARAPGTITILETIDAFTNHNFLQRNLKGKKNLSYVINPDITLLTLWLTDSFFNQQI